ncbi:MAG: protein kinase, partial [Acidobacteriales bacterium]|nr:protein kinase [Terriglobales bacterium]
MAYDAVAQERFEREARAASVLNHPNICTVHDVGEFQGRPFFVMELLEGKSLKDCIASNPLSAEELASIARQVCAALEAAHEKGIVHRDIKPANIFLTNRGPVKVLDFGLAKRSVAFTASGPQPDGNSGNSTVTVTGTIMGTLPYMSPEQAVGEDVDARSDIFSLGASLYEMATGKPPFRGKTPAGVLGSILTESPAKPSAVNPQIPVRLDDLILKALEKEPGRRYQSVADLLVDLNRLNVEKRLRAPSRKYWIGAAAAAIVILGAGVLTWQRIQTRPLTDKGVRVLADFTSRGPSIPAFESLAVLPFENLSGDPQQDYVADGLTETLIGEVAKIPAIRVISRTSVMQYKAARKPLPQIARELNVGAVIQGSIARFGDRARV